jgi:2-polyprenyl-6-methoxyphenol hydroxylase-like FAD-dependent oxidoreductase
VRVLISGCGIAGPTLAYWLTRYGIDCTIVEAAASLRTGGYIVDFWGAGFEIAEKMGLGPQIAGSGYRVREMRVVDSAGKRTADFAVDSIFGLMKGRYVSIPRSDLGAFIFRTIEGRVEKIFGDSIAAIEQTPDGVSVAFSGGQRREFDLVIGADGLHSRVREIGFGPESRFEKYLGFKVAAFQTEGYAPRDELVYVMFTEVGQQVGRFTMRDNRTLFLFTFADRDANLPADVASQKALLRRRFGTSGWECPRILDAMDAANDFYIDRVSQIRMSATDSAGNADGKSSGSGARSGGWSGAWSRGRVALVGDAAFCVSLLAGQGTALAMIAAYILAGELYRANGNYAEAFARYEKLFGPFVAAKQKAALRLSDMFAPHSKTSLWMRNQIFRMLAVKPIAKLAIGASLIDKIALPEY